MPAGASGSCGEVAGQVSQAAVDARPQRDRGLGTGGRGDLVPPGDAEEVAVQLGNPLVVRQQNVATQQLDSLAEPRPEVLVAGLGQEADGVSVGVDGDAVELGGVVLAPHEVTGTGALDPVGVVAVAEVARLDRRLAEVQVDVAVVEADGQGAGGGDRACDGVARGGDVGGQDLVERGATGVLRRRRLPDAPAGARAAGPVGAAQPRLEELRVLHAGDDPLLDLEPDQDAAAGLRRGRPA